MTVCQLQLKCIEPLQLLIFSFDSWLGVFQCNRTLYFTLFTADTTPISTLSVENNILYLYSSTNTFANVMLCTIHKAVNHAQEVGYHKTQITSKEFTTHRILSTLNHHMFNFCFQFQYALLYLW